MATQTPGERAAHSASMLASEIELLADPGVAGLGRSLALVLCGAMEHPAATGQAWFRYAMRLAEIPPAARSNSLDPASYSLRVYHQAFAEFVDQLITAASLGRIEETKARLMTGLMLDALAPGNFWPASPAAGRE